MSILSIEFIGYSIMLAAAYYLLPLKIRPLALLGFSAAFVIMSGWQGGVYLLAAAVITYLGALALQGLRSAEKKRSPEKSARKFVHFRRLLLFFLLTALLGAMAFLKFYPALADWLNGAIKQDTLDPVKSFSPALAKWLSGGWLAKTPLPILELIIPLGLSYFTFQSAGYLIDVSRGKAEAAKNPLRTILFVGYFLYLPQGPISTWKELEGQLSHGHRLDPVQFVSGFQLMVWGYFKKLVVADRIAITTTAVLKAGAKMPGWLAMGGTILYMIRLYADFSGGMDVIRGLSRIVGVELPENFRRPFFATSVAEYWRRWHITLGAWFRSYLLYPLTTCRFGLFMSKIFSKVLGKKVGRMVPTAFTTLLVFLLIGLWHGASLNALVFGLYFGVIMALSLLLDPFWKWLGKKLHLPKGGWMTPIRLVRTWILVLLPQFFAYTPDLAKAERIISRAFAFSEYDFSTFVNRCTIIMPALEWYILGGALLLLLIVDIISEKKKDLSTRLARKPIALRWPLIILLILIVLVFGCYGTDFEAADFVYTQF